MPRDDGGRTEARRQQLLDVAIEAVRAEGPGVSMERIGELSGASKPSMYRAFGSKLGLYRAIADWFIGELITEVATLVGEHLTLREFIERAVNVIFLRIEQDKAIYQFLMRRARLELSSSSGPPADDRPDFLRQMGDAVALLIAERRRQLGSDPGPATVWAHAVIGLINSVADWWMDHPEVPREEVAETVAEILFHGFAPVAQDPVEAPRSTNSA